MLVWGGETRALKQANPAARGRTQRYLIAINASELSRGIAL